LSENRAAPVRLTNKSNFIVNAVLVSVEDSKKSQIIEKALVEKYPLFNEIWENQKK
jgi:hypothetical protein